MAHISFAAETPTITAPPSPQAESVATKNNAVDLGLKIIADYPADALSYALLGSAYYNTGQADEAVKYLRKCLELNPAQADAYQVLALIAYEKGKPEEAASLCHEAIKHGLISPEVLNRLGRSLMDLGQTDEAVKTLQQAVALPRTTSESCYLLGQACLQSGDFAAAKQSFLRAITLTPDHTQAFFGLFNACNRLHQPEEAARYREQFQKLEAIDRKALSERSAEEDSLAGLPQVKRMVARTFFGAAQVYASHGQTNQSSELLQKSANLDPDNTTYRFALEKHFLQLKDINGGFQVFSKMAEAEPKNPLNTYFLGRFQLRLQHPDEAEKSFIKVQDLAPNWFEGYRALAELYLKANQKLPQALRLARMVVELEPTAPHFFFLAVASEKNHDRPSALKAIKQALERNPNEPKYQQFLQFLEKPPEPSK